MVPHITDAIQEWVERVAQQPVKGNVKPEVCIVELGGTIGDIEGMPFVEAFRQFQFRVKVRAFDIKFLTNSKLILTYSSGKTFVLLTYHWYLSQDQQVNRRPNRLKHRFVNCGD